MLIIARYFNLVASSMDVNEITVAFCLAGTKAVLMPGHVSPRPSPLQHYFVSTPSLHPVLCIENDCSWFTELVKKNSEQKFLQH